MIRRALTADPTSQAFRGSQVARGQRGSALLATLWFAAILAILAGQLFYLVSNHTRITGSQIATARDVYLMDAGLAYALAILRTGPEPGAVPFGASFSLAGETVTVRIENETGKIDLNTALADEIQAAFALAGVPVEQSAAARDRLLDWIDPDDVSRSADSAERDEYFAAGLNYGPANAPVEVLATLRLVPGLEGIDLRRLARFATLHRPDLPLNRAAIPGEVKAILGDRADDARPQTLRSDTLSVHIGLHDGSAQRSAYFRREGGGFMLIEVEAI